MYKMFESDFFKINKYIKYINLNLEIWKNIQNPKLSNSMLKK